MTIACANAAICLAAFSYLSPEQRVPAEHPLRAIRDVVDVALKELSSFARLYPDWGRTSLAPEKLLRALLRENAREKSFSTD